MTLFDVWCSGLSLDDAVQRSAGGRDWARAHARALAHYRDLRTDPRSPLIDRAMTMTRLQALGSEWEDQIRLQERAREAVREALARGDMVALGFARDEPAEASRLSVVPSAMWCQEVDIRWQASAAVAGSRTFEDLRVVARNVFLAAPESGEGFPRVLYNDA